MILHFSMVFLRFFSRIERIYAICSTLRILKECTRLYLVAIRPISAVVISRVLLRRRVLRVAVAIASHLRRIRVVGRQRRGGIAALVILESKNKPHSGDWARDEVLRRNGIFESPRDTLQKFIAPRNIRTDPNRAGVELGIGLNRRTGEMIEWRESDGGRSGISLRSASLS